jgi:two-component system cell cycle response regulator DivK
VAADFRDVFNQQGGHVFHLSVKKKLRVTRHIVKPLAECPVAKLSPTNTAQTSTKPRAKRLSASTSKKRILVVDDDPQSLAVHSALLSQAGYNVDQADNALAAICAVVRHAPDLVLADIRMPIMDGKELVLELKRHRDSRHIPVVALTGHDTPGMRESAIKAGYDDYITKPIVPRRFPEQIAEFLRRHKLNRPAESTHGGGRADHGRDFQNSHDLYFSDP